MANRSRCLLSHWGIQSIRVGQPARVRSESLPYPVGGTGEIASALFLAKLGKVGVTPGVRRQFDALVAGRSHELCLVGVPSLGRHGSDRESLTAGPGNHLLVPAVHDFKRCMTNAAAQPQVGS